MPMVPRIALHRRDPVRVLLYDRPGCHLCEDAEHLLLRLASRYPIQIEKIDIMSDPDLVRRFDIRIPVIVIGEAVELEAPIDGNELERALKSVRRLS